MNNYSNEITNQELKGSVEVETVKTADEKVEVSEPTNSVENTTVEKVEIQHVSPLNEDLVLNRLDERFVYDTMAVPTASRHEFRLQAYILFYAKAHGIDYDIDDAGNIYLTKGTVKDGEFYPCVTSHMDTVQDDQIFYAKAGVPLTIKTRINKDKKHEIYVDGFGIGGDDKAGVTICLSMFNHLDTLKACFFVQEEIGCLGSAKIDMSKEFYRDWFGNVGYVLGFDSPELNRAAHTCSGTKLMNRDFFEGNGLDKICKDHGLDTFKSEPFTDVKTIREKTEIICMNFGTGYWNCHMASEYCVLEEMDIACDLGISIIEKLGKTSHKMSAKTTYNYADNNYFESLSPKSYHYNNANARNYSGYEDDYYDGYRYDDKYYNQKSNTTQTQTTKTVVDTKNTMKNEMVEYIAKVYEDRENSIKQQIEEICKNNGIEFNIFENVFNKKIVF